MKPWHFNTDELPETERRDAWANAMNRLCLPMGQFPDDGDFHGDISVLGGATSAKAAHLHRICQTIETLLSDPNLTPGRVAEEHGVSLRYLQKLFTLSGKTFSNYVRTRRLERCRAELVSPLYADLSITEICYRWGFNASAHFSRAFRAHYNISPREYRRNNTSR